MVYYVYLVCGYIFGTLVFLTTLLLSSNILHLMIGDLITEVNPLEYTSFAKVSNERISLVVVEEQYTPLQSPIKCPYYWVLHMPYDTASLWCVCWGIMDLWYLLQISCMQHIKVEFHFCIVGLQVCPFVFVDAWYLSTDLIMLKCTY